MDSQLFIPADHPDCALHGRRRYSSISTYQGGSVISQYAFFNRPLVLGLHLIPLSPAAVQGLSISYIPITFRNLTNNPYAGKPNADIDGAWDELMAPMHIRVTGEELLRDNQESVALPEAGGYLGWLGAFHELHCIVSPLKHHSIDGHLGRARTEKRVFWVHRICYDDGIIASTTILTSPLSRWSICFHTSVRSLSTYVVLRLILRIAQTIASRCYGNLQSVTQTYR